MKSLLYGVLLATLTAHVFGHEHEMPLGTESVPRLEPWGWLARQADFVCAGRVELDTNSITDRSFTFFPQEIISGDGITTGIQYEVHSWAYSRFRPITNGSYVIVFAMRAPLDEMTFLQNHNVVASYKPEAASSNIYILANRYGVIPINEQEQKKLTYQLSQYVTMARSHANGSMSWITYLNGLFVAGDLEVRENARSDISYSLAHADLDLLRQVQTNAGLRQEVRDIAARFVTDRLYPRDPNPIYYIGKELATEPEWKQWQILRWHASGLRKRNIETNWQDHVRIYLNSTNGLVKVYAAQALLKRASDRSVIPTLVSLLDSKDVQTRSSAWEGLVWAMAQDGFPMPPHGDNPANRRGIYEKWLAWLAEKK